MFRQKKGTIIAEGLKITGTVAAEGLVEVNGYIEGDLHCTSLVVSPQATIRGGIEAESVVVNGRVEGPIRGGEVVLKSRAHVVGDIVHDTLFIEKGAYFEGQSVRSRETTAGFEKPLPEEINERWNRRPAPNGRERSAPPAE